MSTTSVSLRLRLDGTEREDAKPAASLSDDGLLERINRIIASGENTSSLSGRSGRVRTPLCPLVAAVAASMTSRGDGRRSSRPNSFGWLRLLQSLRSRSCRRMTFPVVVSGSVAM